MAAQDAVDGDEDESAYTIADSADTTVTKVEEFLKRQEQKEQKEQKETHKYITFEILQKVVRSC